MSVQVLIADDHPLVPLGGLHFPAGMGAVSSAREGHVPAG
ncbi:response regulator transcription factor, partial [Burkholderia pseudomallei]